MRVIRAGDEPGARAMARDEALVQRLRAGEGGGPVVRLHGWSAPVVTMGRGQALPDELGSAAREAGIALARRPTGGGWLLHLPGDLSVTFADPGPLGPGALRATARRVSRAIAQGLEAQGRRADVFTGLSRPASRAEVCFERADRDEVVLGETKAAGVALARLGRSVLVQTALPMAETPAGLLSFARRFDPKRAEASRALEGLDPEKLGGRIARGLAASSGEHLEEIDWPQEWERDAEVRESRRKVALEAANETTRRR